MAVFSKTSSLPILQIIYHENAVLLINQNNLVFLIINKNN